MFDIIAVNAHKKHKTRYSTSTILFQCHFQILSYYFKNLLVCNVHVL